MVEPDSARLDAVLRALADPTRRQTYLWLRAQPGLTTNELASRIPAMTRWGVMKHLVVLRAGGLVQSLEEGRRRRHYADGAAVEPLRHWLAADSDAPAGTGSA